MVTKEYRALTDALGVRHRELLSLVGGGGKSRALRLLAQEAADSPTRRVVATTSTAMYVVQLQAVGPLVVGRVRARLFAALRSVLDGGGPVAAARGLAGEGKVTGLPPAWVDELWGAVRADLVVVEADGSRGRSLKAFGPHEPQVPDRTSLIVQVAGLDVLGSRLDGDQVHRAELLVEALSSGPAIDSRPRLGASITSDIFLDALRLQCRVLRSRWPAARIVTLLNKADDGESIAAGLQTAHELLAPPPGEVAPEAVVVGSVQRSAFTRCAPAGPLVSAVVLAAGRSTRMGSQKLLLPVGGRPMIESVVAATTGSRTVETLVVVGSEAAAVRRAVSGSSVRIVENPDYERGMSTSLAVGVSSVRPDCDAVLFVLGDQPFLDRETVDRLIDRFAETRSGIVRPLVGGRPAHPVLMAASYIPEIMALEGDMGAREILARHAADVAFVDVSDTCLAMDVDTPADYQVAADPGR